MMKKLLLLIVATFFATTSFAKIEDVELVVSGIAPTKDEALTKALRSAIEQTFGTFVSANTSIVNDELTKDEIVSISSGNIKKYEILSEIQLPNNQFSVTLSTVVSLTKLTQFAKIHGSSCEFAGNVFAQNIKLKELNKRSEEIALRNLQVQMTELEKCLFDISITSVGEPRLHTLSRDIKGETVKVKGYLVPINITFKGTENSDSYLRLYFSTLKKLRLSKQEIADYEATNYPYHKYLMRTWDYETLYRDTFETKGFVYPVKFGHTNPDIICDYMYRILKLDFSAAGKCKIKVSEYCQSYEYVPSICSAEYILGCFRSDSVPNLVLHGQAKSLKIHCKGTNVYFNPVEIFSELYDYDNRTRDNYQVTQWDNNCDHDLLISNHEYNRYTNYNNLSCCFVYKYKKKKKNYIKNAVVLNTTIDIFVTEEDMPKITGFEIVYDK